MAIAVHSAETWNSGGAYEAYGGRWSRRVAVEFIDWLDMPRDRRWIDIGCGTGGLTETIFARCAPAAVAGIDPSAGYIAHAREHLEDPRVTFEVGNAEALPFPDGTFDVAVCGLVLNFVRDQERCIAEMKRVLQAGGTRRALRVGLRGRNAVDAIFLECRGRSRSRGCGTGPGTAVLRLQARTLAGDLQ
jgi:ubiquinone/menaquinone biosynthesis C-methylase UbiE